MAKINTWKHFISYLQTDNEKLYRRFFSCLRNQDYTIYVGAGIVATKLVNQYTVTVYRSFEQVNKLKSFRKIYPDNITYGNITIKLDWANAHKEFYIYIDVENNLVKLSNPIRTYYDLVNIQGVSKVFNNYQHAVEYYYTLLKFEVVYVHNIRFYILLSPNPCIEPGTVTTDIFKEPQYKNPFHSKGFSNYVCFNVANIDVPSSFEDSPLGEFKQNLANLVNIKREEYEKIHGSIG